MLSTYQTTRKNPHPGSFEVRLLSDTLDLIHKEMMATPAPTPELSTCWKKSELLGCCRS